MKNTNKLSAFLLIGFAVITGCGQQPAKSTADRFQESLTVDELTRLMDYHALKMAVPPSQRPFSQIRLVLIKPDGTVVLKGGGGMGDDTNSPTCEILIGYRIEGDAFSGRLELQTTKVSKDSNFSFSDPFARQIREFGTVFMGPTEDFKRDGYWKNGILQLAADGPPGSTNNTILAIQLVKDVLAGR
jgi:hypothetical protein